MSMRKNISPTPEADETPYFLFLTFRDTLDTWPFPISLPASVAHMLCNGPELLLAEIWKCSEPPSAIGTGNTAPSLYCRLSFSQPKVTRGTDG